jgi:cell division protein FtsL
MQAPVYTASVAKQAQYSLSTMAKVVMAAFAAVVILMLTLICVNTQTIERKSLQIRNLEQQREELIEKNAEVQRRIQEAQSEEAITEYALSQGMIKG